MEVAIVMAIAFAFGLFSGWLLWSDDYPTDGQHR
jgi:hypothetical protein